AIPAVRRACRKSGNPDRESRRIALVPGMGRPLVCAASAGSGRRRAMTIRTFLLDDHALVRTGLRMILAGAVDIEIVGEAESGEDALPRIRELRPDVVVCDMHLPGISGLEVTERLVKGGYGARVVIVS